MNSTQALIVVVNPTITMPEPPIIIDRSTSINYNMDNLSQNDPIYPAEESNISSISSGSIISNPPLSIEDSSRLTDKEEQ